MLKYIAKEKTRHLFLFLIITLAVLCKTVSAIFSAKSMNAIVDQDIENFLYYLMIMFILFIFNLLLTLYRYYFQTDLEQRILTHMRLGIADSINNLSYSKFHEYESGQFVSWLTADMNTISTQGLANFYKSSEFLIDIVISSIALIQYHYSLFVVSIILSVVTILLPKLVDKPIEERTVTLTQTQDKSMSTITEFIQGFDTLFAFNRVNKIKEAIASVSENIAEATKAQRLFIYTSAILGAFGNLIGQIGITGLSGYLIINGHITIGAIMAASSLSTSIFNSVGNITDCFIQVRSVRPLIEKHESIQSESSDTGKNFAPTDSLITLDEVSYVIDGKTVLKPVTETLQASKKYAIVGPSGSGKSTLLNIISGKITDYIGSVKVFGNELKETNNPSIREQIIYIDQNPYIFEGTIRDNITLGEENPQIDMDEILKRSGLTSYIASLEDGLDTSISLSGFNLSGGQKQRISLARGLYSGKEIVLLDEGTSNLDPETAAEIENLLVNDPHITLLMVTHHLTDQIKDQIDGMIQLQD